MPLHPTSTTRMWAKSQLENVLPARTLANSKHSHQDGYYVNINVRVQANTSIQRYRSDIGLQQAVGMQFQTSKEGPDTTTGVLESWQKLSVDELRELNATELIESNRTDQAHLEYLFYPNFYPNMPTPEYAPLPNESYITLSVGLAAAQSIGNVTLQSNSLSDGPVINLNVRSLSRSRQTRSRQQIC